MWIESRAVVDGIGLISVLEANHILDRSLDLTDAKYFVLSDSSMIFYYEKRLDSCSGDFSIGRANRPECDLCVSL